jgi:hypothetical protein
MRAPEMQRLLIALPIIAISTHASAALAPNYQRAREMTAVIDAVAAQLPQHPITKIIYQKPDQYRVVAGPCSVDVSIVSAPPKPGLVGPRQFDVKLGVPRCKR